MSKIEFRKGNLLDSEAEAVVNTVNTVGVMGKGIALLFRKAYPENYKKYKAECRKNKIQVGKMFYVRVGEDTSPNLFEQMPDSRKSEYTQWIINFPTKQHWRSPSKLQWIEDGLKDLQRVIENKRIRSVALPQLGCGNGGLEWRDVEPKIRTTFSGDSDLTIIIYESPREVFQ